eukprot:748377-Hanusia_phi.AAC.3
MAQGGLASNWYSLTCVASAICTRILTPERRIEGKGNMDGEEEEEEERKKEDVEEEQVTVCISSLRRLSFCGGSSPSLFGSHAIANWMARLCS